MLYLSKEFHLKKGLNYSGLLTISSYSNIVHFPSVVWTVSTIQIKHNRVHAATVLMPNLVQHVTAQCFEHQLQEQMTYSVQIIMFNTNTYNFIFARASLNLTIASSCLTVIGIVAASPVSFACSLMSYRKYHNNEVNLDTGPTQWSSFWNRNSATEQSNSYSQVTFFL